MPRGGKRTGSGRKSGTTETVKRVEREVALKATENEITIVRASAGGKAVTAAMILASVDEQGLWHKHLGSNDERVALTALQYLTDRRDGKPKQALEVDDKRKDPAERLEELLSRQNQGDSGKA